MLTNRFWWLYCICVEECPSLKEIHTKVFKDDGSLGGQLTLNDSGEKKFFILGFQLVCSFFQNQTEDFTTYAWASPLEGLVPFEVRSRHVHLLKAPRGGLHRAASVETYQSKLHTNSLTLQKSEQNSDGRSKAVHLAEQTPELRTSGFKLIHSFILLMLYSQGPVLAILGKKKNPVKRMCLW